MKEKSQMPPLIEDQTCRADNEKNQVSKNHVYISATQPWGVKGPKAATVGVNLSNIDIYRECQKENTNKNCKWKRDVSSLAVKNHYANDKF